jgi:hypothetical protein
MYRLLQFTACCTCCHVAPTTCRIAKRKQALPAKDRRQLGYAVPTGKKDTGKTVLLTEDVAESLQEVRAAACAPHPAQLLLLTLHRTSCCDDSAAERRWCLPLGQVLQEARQHCLTAASGCTFACHVVDFAKAADKAVYLLRGHAVAVRCGIGWTAHHADYDVH